MSRGRILAAAGLSVVAAGLLGAALVAALMGWLWFKPSGSGESRASPDGRYRASAYNMRARTWRGDRVSFVQIRVEERRTRREVWNIVYYPLPGEEVPDYGWRGERFIEWSGDEPVVTIVSPHHQTLALPVP